MTTVAHAGSSPTAIPLSRGGKSWAGNLTVVSVSDPEYFRHARALASSLAHNFPSVQLHLHLVNPDREQLRDLNAVFPEVEIVSETRRFDSLEQKRAFCAGLRASVLSRLLELDRGPLLYLDADTLVRRHLDDLVLLIHSHDIVALERPSSVDSHLRYATGVLGVRGTRASRDFVRRWADLIDRDEPFWFQDQICFLRAVSQAGVELDFRSLPDRFIDWHFGFGSPIWVGKGPRKHYSRLYLLEEEYYLRKADCKPTIALTLKSAALGGAHAIYRSAKKKWRFLRGKTRRRT